MLGLAQRREPMADVAPDPAFEATVHEAFRAFNERRFADFSTYVTDDLVETYPQSGEVMVGKQAERGMHEAFPDPPTFTIRDIHRDGNLAVVEVDEAYPDGSTWKTAFILELRDGRIARLTGYFGEPFPPAPWRRQFTTGSNAANAAG
jgi:ketosteroid isomerase-like protein